MNRNRRCLLFFILSLAVFSLISCSGGGDDAPAAPSVLRGVFVDSPVTGLNYKTATRSGVTDSNGAFQYLGGETVSFSIGDVLIGEGKANSITTPIDLVEDAEDENNTTVTNICRFLLTLDQDGNPDNGINITREISNEVNGKDIDFSQTLADFEDSQIIMDLLETLNSKGLFTVEGEKALVGVEEARRHLRISMITYLDIEPKDPTIPLGTSQQFAVTGSYLDGKKGDVTNFAVWSATKKSVANFAEADELKGKAFSNGVGGTAVNATLNNIKASTYLTVSEAAPTEIEITPKNSYVSLGEEKELKATLTFTDGSMEDVTGQVDWVSSNSSIAYMEQGDEKSGVAVSVGIGTVSISVSWDDLSASTNLTVTDAEISSIEITPLNASLPLGRERQFAATGIYSDETTRNITNQVNWSSSDTAIADFEDPVSGKGLVAATGVGIATLYAELEGVSVSTQLTVTNAQLTEILVTPESSSVPLGINKQFTASGIYTDGTSLNITTQASWKSSNVVVASVSNAVGSVGLVSCLGTGKADIEASYLGLSDSANITVTDAELTSMEISPANPTVALGNTVEFALTGLYSNGTTPLLTQEAVWSSGDEDVAMVSNAYTTKGQATSTGVGTATITAKYSGITATNNLTVTDAELMRIRLSPETPELPLGHSRQFTATGVYSDGNTEDITEKVVWSSTDTTIVALSNTSGKKGLATTVGVGTAKVEAKFDDEIVSTQFTVTDAELTSILISPESPMLPIGTQKQMSATGVYTDGSNLDLTSQAVWRSSDEFVATANNSNKKGLVSCASIGATDISATFDGLSGETELTVTDAKLTAITVTPEDASVTVGEKQQFAAVGEYTDGTNQNITTRVIWASSQNNLVSVSNAEGTKGEATALGLGSATITASQDGITGETGISVTGE